MKRILSLMLAAMLLCLCACGGAEGDAADTPQAPVAGNTANPITAEFALEAQEVDNVFMAEVSEYTSYILFTAADTLTDVRVTVLNPNGTYYIIGDELYAQDTMAIGETLLAGVVYYGDMTTYGISFADSNGVYRNYALFMSGKDGSLILQEYVP